jgi:2-phospho-L-lactate guanylyltransferase
MSTRLIVPHRGLASAKSRLAAVLDAHERMALAERLLVAVLHAARAAVDDVVVISPAPELEPHVVGAGARLIVQHGMGLNRGLDEAREAALRDGIELLIVLHGDLPNLAPDDVRAIVAASHAQRSVAIAPDRAGTGTNGLALRPPDIIGFRFGGGSLAAHREEAVAAGVEPVLVARDGLAFDLDTPHDLARWLELGSAA